MNDENPIIEEKKEAKTQAERDFTFMLSTYCIRPFISRLNSSAPPNPTRTPTQPRQVFGELPSPSPEEKPRTVNLDDTQTALSWYFGAAGVKNCPGENHPRLGFGIGQTASSMGVWERVKRLVKMRLEKMLANRKQKIKFEELKRRIRGARTGLFRVGERMGYKLLAATERSCLRHGFRSLD